MVYKITKTHEIREVLIMKKLELSYEVNKALGRNRNTVLSLWYKIAYFEEKYGYCDKTNNDFARMLGISLATVKRSLSKLIELGLVGKEKLNYWQRKLYAIRPTLESDDTVTEPTCEPTSEPIYINIKDKNINNKYNVVSIKDIKSQIKQIEIDILKDEFESEVVDKALHILNQKEDQVFNPLKYTRGICLNIIKNKKSLARKEAKKQKQLALFEEIKASRKRVDFVVPNNWYYNWMEV